MPALTIPQVIADFYNHNEHAWMPRSGKTAKNTLSYYMGCLWSYDLAICEYNHRTHIFTIFNHTAKGMANTTPTTSGHIMKLKRFLDEQGAISQMVNHNQDNHLTHQLALYPINRQYMKVAFLREINRIQKEHYIFDKYIFKYVFLPFLQ